MTDFEIMQAASGTAGEIAQWVRAAACRAGAAHRPHAFAKAVSRLLGAEELDEVEELIVALRRSRAITPLQGGLLQAQYLRQKGGNGK